MTLCHFCHCAEHGHTPSVGIALALIPSEEAERARAVGARDDQARRERARQERMSHWRSKKPKRSRT